jgi:peptidoglycan hydrolase-like protein with peptidoglycan-binding domain
MRVLSILVAFLAATLLLAPQASALPAWPSVSQGATGPNVTTVQYLLRHHGHTIAADGQFGSATRSAVIAFQSARGLTADGTVGSQTWPQLVVAVRQGSTGEAVRAAQTQLNRYGAGLAVDGQFGSATDRAVRNFQGAHGLAVDGQVGPQTWQTLVGGGGGNPAATHCRWTARRRAARTTRHRTGTARPRST